jgi:hypothetical protein
LQSILSRIERTDPAIAMLDPDTRTAIRAAAAANESAESLFKNHGVLY